MLQIDKLVSQCQLPATATKKAKYLLLHSKINYPSLKATNSVRESEEFYNRLSNQIRGNISIVSRL
jgi:hypothetical protein